MRISTFKVCFLILLSGIICNAMPSKDSNQVTGSAKKGRYYDSEEFDDSSVFTLQPNGDNIKHDDDSNVYIPLIRDVGKLNLLDNSKREWPLKKWKIEREARPAFLSAIGNAFGSPATIMAAFAIPLFFIGTLLFPYIANMFASVNMLPQVTTTIASGVARRLDGRDDGMSADRILDIINEYGARSLEDPQCLQRFLCQTVTFGVGGQRNDPWSALEVLNKIVKSIGEETWDAFRMKEVMKHLKNGKCDNLKCNGSRAYLTNDLSVVDKVVSLGSKLYKYRDVFKKY